MPYKHVFGPTKGIMTNGSPTAIPRDATPYCKGIYLKNDAVCSDYGHTTFPVPSATQTNRLADSVMRLDQYYKLSGESWLLGLTTSNIYQYMSTPENWMCITPGTTVEDCEDVWTANANVTATADATYYLKGSKSSKLVVAAGFGTGVAAYENFGSMDLSTRTALHFWIRVSKATVATELDIRISEQNAGGVGASYEDVSIPALEADVWTAVCVTFAGATATRNAVLSASLIVATDTGAITVYLDDLRAVTKFTGDEDNRFSFATMNDTFTFTNGIDQTKKITEAGGTLTVADLATALATGTISTSELVFAFKDHLILLNNTENAADAPQRVSWTNIGAIEDWTNGTAGYQDLYDDESWIVAIEGLSENEVVIYKERSIVIMMWVGGHTPFRFYTMISGSGCLSKEAVTNVGGEHIVFGPDLVYAYKGEKTTDAMDDNVKDTMYSRLDRENAGRVFLLYVEEDDELQVWMPTTTSYPDDVWCLNMVREKWYRKTRTMTGFGYYQEQSSLTIGDLVGTIGEQNWRFGDMLTKAYAPITLVGNNSGHVFKLDKMTLNNAGTAISNEFQTPDFVLPDTEYYMDKYMRVSQFIFEGMGQSVTTSWSDDGGSSWHPTEGAGANTIALTSSYNDYQQDFDTVTKKIRFKFLNTTASSGFKIKHYGFKWILRSGRR